MRRWGFRVGILMVLAVVAACASYTTRLKDLRGTVTRGELHSALEMVDKVSDPGDLLYHLERGALHHYGEQWSESNAELAEAEQLLEDLYTISVSERALTFILNDEAEAYRGEVYEGHLLHYYRLLNYHHLGQPGETAVEARRLGLRLATLRDDFGDDPALREMPFLQWLIGAVLESNGEYNDALIAYRWAVRGYADWAGSGGPDAPDWIELNLLRTAARSGIDPDAIEESSDSPPALRLTARSQAAGNEAELVLLCELGWAAQKQSEHIRIPIFKHESDWSGADQAAALGIALAGRYDYYLAHGAWSDTDFELAYFLDVAIPVLPDHVPSAVSYCEVTVEPLNQAEGELSGRLKGARLEPALDVEGLLRHVYRKGMSATLAKTFARALLKYVAQDQAKKELGAVAGLLANIAGAATEKADTRAWLLLPAQVQASSLRLPPGAYRVSLAAYDPRGGKVGERRREVELGSGDLGIVSWRVFD